MYAAATTLIEHEPKLLIHDQRIHFSAPWHLRLGAQEGETGMQFRNDAMRIVV
jgi:hypothetical protein